MLKTLTKIIKIHTQKIYSWQIFFLQGLESIEISNAFTLFVISCKTNIESKIVLFMLTPVEI